MLARLGTFFYGAALVSLPWAGVGVLKLSTGRDWGGGLQASWVFMAAAVICFGLDRLRGRSSTRGTGSVFAAGPYRWWLLGCGAILLSVLVSVAGLWLAPAGESADLTLWRFGKQFVQLVIMMVFVIWPALWTRGRRRWAWTVKLLVIGGLVQVVYGLWQGWDYYQHSALFCWLDGISTSNPAILSGSGELYLGDSFRNVPRLRGMACEPLYLGNYLLFLLPWLMVPVWSARARRLAAGAFLVLLMWTWSRGAWLGFMVQVLLAGWFVLRMVKKRGRDLIRFDKGHVRTFIISAVALLIIIPLVGLVAGWDVLLFPYRRLAQTFSSRDWSNLTRLYSMQAAWRAFLLSPVVGIGWGQFGWHFPALVDPMGLQSQFTWPVVNNFPLLILCETGLMGFLVFVAWVVGLARGVRARLAVWFRQDAGLAALTSDTPWSGYILVAATVSAVGVWGQLLTFSQYNLPHIWVSAGLLMGMLADGDMWSGSETGEQGP